MQRSSHRVEIGVDLRAEPVWLGLYNTVQPAAQPVDLRADRGRVAGLAVEVQGQLLRGQPLRVEDEKSEQFRAPCGQRKRASVEACGRVAARQQPQAQCRSATAR